MTPPDAFPELLSFIADAAPGLVAYLDAQGRYQYVNRAYEEWHGKPRSHWLGRTPRELLGEAAYVAMEPHVRAALAGKRVRYSRSLTYPNGITRFIEATYVPHVLPGGQVVGFAAFVQDATERHQLEQERERSQRRVKLLADMSHVFGQVSTDLQATLDTLARRISETLGHGDATGLVLRGEQDESLHVTALYHPDPEALRLLRATIDSAPWQPGSLTERVARTGQAVRVPQVPPVKLKASQSPLSPRGLYLARYGISSVLAVPLKAQGQTLGVITAARGPGTPAYTVEDQDYLQDLADRAALVISNTRLLAETQAARLRAEEASRLKDEFLATLSHELRTPLTSMLGWVQMLRGGILAPDKQRKAFEIIERNTRAQAQLVEDILDVSRIITGKLRLEVRPVELAGVVEAAVESVRPAADARGVALHVLIDSAVGPVLGDSTRLQQIIWNLLSNAVKFTPRGGRVRASVEKKESVALLQVTDSGQGIPADFLPHVFERFRQADSSTTRTSSGLGLGLAIVKHLVELHGGSVEAFSEGPGQGSTFTVRLPFMAAIEPATQATGPTPPAAEPPESASLRPPTALAGLRVLVVDDEEDAREMLRILLSNCGLRVSVASSSREGLEALRRERPEVLVSDIGMPGEDGYSFLRKVRALASEEGGRTPAVALTAYSRAEDRTRALRAGFNMHLPKPVDLSELLLVLASVTGRQGT